MKGAVIVTGASRGIGAELAIQLAEKAITVYAVARSGKEIQELQKAYPNIIPIEADLSTEPGINRVIAAVSGTQIGGLVNNAARLDPKLIKDRTFSEYNDLFHTNITAPALLIKGLCNEKKLTDSARIINVSSQAADNFLPGLSAYSISKRGLDILPDIVKKERLFGESNILIASFIPGEVETGMQEQLRQFPELGLSFRRAQREGRLISASLSAQWFTWLLLKATPDEFISAHTIYNSVYYSHWLRLGQSISDPAEFTKDAKQINRNSIWEESSGQNSSRSAREPLSGIRPKL